jgi:hypothetical protein
MTMETPNCQKNSKKSILGNNWFNHGISPISHGSKSSDKDLFKLSIKVLMNESSISG